MKARTARSQSTRLAVATASAVTLWLAAIGPADAAWERARADGANSGFVDVVTRPATKGSVSVPGLGTFAPGAGPVTAPDGRVFIGTEQGKLFALTAEGQQVWSQQLPGGQAILASPLIGPDNALYVIGVSKVRDHRVEPAVTRFDSALYKFELGGALQWRAPFPTRYVGGIAGAAPNFMRSAAMQVVVAPVVFPSGRNDGVFDMDLVAFALDGAVVGQTVVIRFSYDVTGSGGIMNAVAALMEAIFGGSDFTSRPIPPEADDLLPPNTMLPMPGVATIDGTPWVIASDSVDTIVGYHFLPGDGFVERFRTRQKGVAMRSSPVVVPDGHTAIAARYGEGRLGAVIFGGPNASALAPVDGLTPIDATPTRTVDNLVVVVERDTRIQTKTTGGRLAVLREGQLVSSVGFSGQSIAPAAASRTHIFVSTASALITFDAAGQTALATFPWFGGGLWPPVIGPQGHVYAMASNILFVFPPSNFAPPFDPSKIGVLNTGQQPTPKSDVVFSDGKILQPVDQGSPPPQPASQTFQPPLTKSGKRLYACQDFDGHGCGAPVAATFCQQQGFTQASKLDTQSQKVQAETLDGQPCDKKKCKVFELIVCNR